MTLRLDVDVSPAVPFPEIAIFSGRTPIRTAPPLT
jgi:hypothetical protein